MKTKAINSFFVLFAIAAGVFAMTPAAFADHPEVTIVPAQGSGVTGCEETEEGCYIPKVATVDVGGVVIFSNTDTVAHTFTAGTIDGGLTNEFDTGLLMVDNSFEWKAETVGEIPYFCIVHPWMEGLIIVQEAGAADDKGDHGDDHGDDKDGMMHSEGDATATGMLSDSTMVSIWTSEPTAGERMEISIEFADSEHVNHDIIVTQDGNEVLSEEDRHHHDGTGVHKTAPLDSDSPVDITITFQGYGNAPLDQRTGPIGEEVVFTNVVPEFGTIAMMVLAVAIISIVAVTAKSRVVPRF